MEFLGGFMKGFKPLMDAAGVKPDDEMQVTILRSEVSDLEGKKRDALAEVGQAAYNMVGSNSWDREKLLPLCKAVDDAELALKNKKEEFERVNSAYEKKKKEEEERVAARTCPSCGEVNPEGTRFCQSCGTKLGVVKEKENICRSCGAKNNPGSSFCGECGARLEAAAPSEVTCPRCGVAYPVGTRFCNECGARLQ